MAESILDDQFLIVWFVYSAVLYLIVTTLYKARQRSPSSKQNHNESVGAHQARTSTYDSFKHDENADQVIHTKVPSRAYGLGPEELASSVLREEPTEDDDITMRELRKLQQSDAFKRWCVSRKMTQSDLQDLFSREHVYRKLKEIHPASFWSLCSPSSLSCVDVVDPSVCVLLGEYIVSRCIDIGVCTAVCMYLYAYWSTLTQVQFWVCGANLYAVVIRHWCKSRTSGSPFFSTWYETRHLSEEYYTSSGIIRSILANVLENVFVIGSGGVLGLIVSVYVRLTRGQTIGERLAGVRLIVEQTRRVDK